MICPFKALPYRSCPMSMTIHKVKKGDTFYKLAQEYNTTVMAIMAANPSANPYNLLLGSSLCIPVKNQPCKTGTTHTIKPGDTIYSIAKFYNISPDALIDSNPGVDPDNLLIGQPICIPLDALPEPCAQGASIYTIKAGDTFYRLAKENNLPLTLLINANPAVNPEAIIPGQRICIPLPWSEYTNPTYKVRFRYPSRWSQVDSERYEGIDGFFQIAAISSEGSLEEVCRNEAFHRLNPYGTRPVISRITAAGKQGCLISPSADQPEEMRNQSAFIIPYPNPVIIAGQSYQYFILWANKQHIRDILNTLVFLPS